MQSIFERHEKKYLITKEQGEALKKIISQYMEAARYGEYLVHNIYYDNEAWEVIRRSIEKPLYKEKMRLRSYDIPDKDSEVYLELKKKYNGIVYKRRAPVSYGDLIYRGARDIMAEGNSQILRELNFYMTKNLVTEKVYVAYNRTAYTGSDNWPGQRPGQGQGPLELRITFDADIRFRLDELNFLNPDHGSLLLPKDTTVMEIKAQRGMPPGMPLWLARVLSDLKIFPRPFSKYGVCYTDFILREEKLSA